MNLSNSSLSTASPSDIHFPSLPLSTPVANAATSPSAPASESPAGEILAGRWPTLARALSRYEHNTAERFSRMAYDLVDSGIIRHDDRRRLAAAADELSIRSFDAQLLIACAIRQWALDHAFDPTPSRHAPALSPEYRAWSRVWLRIALIICTAAILDGLILWKWLS